MAACTAGRQWTQRECGALQGEPRLITHIVKFYEKGNLPIEFVSSRQWFIKLLEQKDKLIKAGQRIKWKPAHMQHRYEEWANGLHEEAFSGISQLATSQAPQP